MCVQRYKINVLVIFKCLSRPRVIKLISCSAELSIKFQLLIKTKMLKRKLIFLAFKLSTVGILIFMSRMNFVQKKFYNLEAWPCPINTVYVKCLNFKHLLLGNNCRS